MKLFEILESVRRAALDESIQDMIKDMRRTQHGDINNPFYDSIKDKHREGGVWKHTLLTIDALPLVAGLMGHDYLSAYEDNKNELRSAALFHDIGKIATQKPASKQSGTYSFPAHDTDKVVKSLFAEYGIEYDDDTLVRFLVAQHHAMLKDIPALRAEYNDDNVRCVLILKAANMRATGPVSPEHAVSTIRPYMDAFEQEEDHSDDIPSVDDWSVEDIDWAPGFKMGFVKPVGGKEHIARGVKQSEDPDDETLEFDADEEVAEGEAKLRLTIVTSHFAAGSDFKRTMKLAMKIRPEWKGEIEEAFQSEVLAFLSSQPDAPGGEETMFGEGERPIDVALDTAKSFKVVEQTKKQMTFELYITVAWG